MVVEFGIPYFSFIYTSSEKKLDIMKKLFLPIAILSIMLLMSCTKQEKIYSCDSELNEWVAKHSDDFHGITRTQLATLPPSIQKVIYRTLTGSEKYNLWMEKLNIVKNNTLYSDLSSEITDLTEKIDIDWYESDLQESLNTNDSVFLNNWEDQVLNSGKIDSTDYIINFCTLMTANEIDLLLNYSESLDHSWIVGLDLPSITSSLKAAPQDCSCRYDIYCNIFLAEECEEGGCTQVYDCGLVGSSKCKGLCPEEIAPID